MEPLSSAVVVVLLGAVLRCSLVMNVGGGVFEVKDG
jgi:hypothetical protein